MPLVNAQAIVSRERGVAAFNVIQIEHAEAIVAGRDAVAAEVTRLIHVLEG
jgi:hypothetical protein